MTTHRPGRLDHSHRVVILLDLECGHQRIYPMALETVAAQPLYARPGQHWPCQPCGKAWPTDRLITATRYSYCCPTCEAAKNVPPSTDAQRPPSRPYEHEHGPHEHGPHDIAGYVIVRTIPGDDGRATVEDAEWIPGACSFALAAATVDRLNAQSPDEGPHVIVPVHTDGCRRDHH